MVQDTTLSRWRGGFESRWGYASFKGYVCSFWKLAWGHAVFIVMVTI